MEIVEKKSFRKTDLILILGLVIVFGVILLVINLLKSPGNMVLVSIDGQPKESFPLSQDLEYVIEGYNGGTNTLVIKDGCAYLKDTSCPDHLCEMMGKIKDVGQSVICLPNRVVVEIIGDGKSNYDAVVGG